MQELKNIIKSPYFVAAAVIVLLIYFFRKGQAKATIQNILGYQASPFAPGSQNEDGQGIDYNNLSQATPGAAQLTLSFPSLYHPQNLKGPMIRSLQQILNSMQANNTIQGGELVTDGSYGPRTADMHKQAQQKLSIGATYSEILSATAGTTGGIAGGFNLPGNAAAQDQTRLDIFTR